MCYVTKHSKPQLKLEKNLVIFQVVRSKQIDAWTILEKQNKTELGRSVCDTLTQVTSQNIIAFSL